VDDAAKNLHEKIQALKAAAEDLAAAGKEIPAVACNTARIRASVKMLELGISDLFDLGVSGGSRKGEGSMLGGLGNLLDGDR
jgi:hypothetical protein